VWSITRELFGPCWACSRAGQGLSAGVGQNRERPGERLHHLRRAALAPTPYAGVEWKKLRFDTATGHNGAAALRARRALRRPPPSQGEQYLVLSGSLQDSGRTWGRAPTSSAAGPVHVPSSAEGCLLRDAAAPTRSSSRAVTASEPFSFAATFRPTRGPERLAMLWVDDGGRRRLPFAHFADRSRRLAAGLTAPGVARRDRDRGAAAAARVVGDDARRTARRRA
jgi:hypothetical protein